jgi:alkylation response protein AidB-like acyl-CoA dehydrogenase
MTNPTEEAVRAEIRAWLEATWDPNLGLIEWREKLVDAGWGAPTWPKAFYGRELEPALAAVVEAEMRQVGAIGAARSGVRNLAIQTLLAHGTDDQKRKFLRGALTGQDSWCQLFSEPGGCCWPAPTGTRPSTRACRTSSSTCISRAWKCGRCGR